MTIIKIIPFLIFILITTVIIFIIRAAQLPSKLRKAEELINQNEFGKANEILRRILDKKRGFVPARYLRAQILMKQKQYVLAISELNAILSVEGFQKHVNELDIHYRLAELYYETQQWQKELEEYRIILVFNPDDVRANRRVGLVEYNQKNFRLAQDHLEKAVTIDPSLADCLLPLGVSCYNNSESDKAEKVLLRAAELSYGQHEAQYYLGLIYKSRMDHETAILMFESARKENRFYLSCLFNLGEIYFENGHYDRVVEILEGGLASLKGKDEESLAYRYLLAETFEAQNKIKEAVYHWESISETDSGYRDVRLKLEDYKSILDNENMRILFNTSLVDLQPLIVEIIARLNFNIISKREVSGSEYVYKAFSIKKINDPPILISFNRTTREITEGQILDFERKIAQEKCSSGIYIATSRFNIRAKSTAAAKSIDLFDSSFLKKTMEKISLKKPLRE